ncbi:MAG: hypothetical protein Q4G51_09430, partial [Dermatophilus congolensis]|nr:hypothetical protein [Dermatophilus congolensis]
MSVDPRVALAALVAALERHLEAAASRHGENDEAVRAAYDAVEVAFEKYEEALEEAFDEVTPLVVYREDDDFD